MLGIMALSWLKVNLKKKTENGHCHNSLHNTTETNKSANCLIGSNFHRDLYIDFASLLEDFVSNIKACILHQYRHHQVENENVSNISR